MADACRTSVALPIDSSMYVLAARGFAFSDLDVDDGDEFVNRAMSEERPVTHCWWHARVTRVASPEGLHEEGVFGSGETAPKRHKPSIDRN